MTLNDISCLNRFLGVIEGVAISLPEETREMVFDYLATVDRIVDEEAKKVAVE